MDKYVIKKAKQMIDDEIDSYSKNFIVKEYQSELDTPEAKKQVDAAMFNMESSVKRIEWLKKFVKSHSKRESLE